MGSNASKLDRTARQLNLVPESVIAQRVTSTPRSIETLQRVQPHRLRALILEDLERFPDSGAEMCTAGSALRSMSGPSDEPWRPSSTAARSCRAGSAGGAGTDWPIYRTAVRELILSPCPIRARL